MPRRWPFYSLALGVSLFCVLSLSGCDTLDFLAKLFRFKDHANAQVLDRPVQTVVIRAGSFSIDANAINFETNIDVRDEVTIYQQITGTAFFTLQDGTAQNIDLTTSDTIIERPATNLLTIIRGN